MVVLLCLVLTTFVIVLIISRALNLILSVTSFISFEFDAHKHVADSTRFKVNYLG